ncbi:MAG: GntR family transcriptional regulator [Boseongicola sp. SB0664_bin_43]|uniref:GntR family transcriptional regulator n=1 Tax=Boseongicola sp. SB0664_bin_43 TaxID=2604844 RepID=A0A6B0Y019_9RHOB|nr:GntR family transcriptional regulator [Boseongicola sp. SB0664_bin_43]
MQQSSPLKQLLDEEFEPLRRASFAEEAAIRLRELILLEKLPPSCPINERELSELLGISRTPVREAIRQLEIEGLVEYTQTRRPRIADPSMATLEHWLAIQGALEGLAGELACSRATDDELSEIESLHVQMVERVDDPQRVELFRIDMAFHGAIVAAAHNPPLVETHNQYNARLWRARFISSQRRANRELQTSKHQDIVDALLARDPERASTALRSHLENAVSNIQAARREREGAAEE